MRKRIWAFGLMAVMAFTAIGFTAAPVAANHEDPTFFDVVVAQDASTSKAARGGVWLQKQRQAIRTLHQVRDFRDHGNPPRWLRACRSETRDLIHSIIRYNRALLRYARGQRHGWDGALNPLRAKILARSSFRAAARNYTDVMEAWEDCVLENARIPRRIRRALP